MSFFFMVFSFFLKNSFYVRAFLKSVQHRVPVRQIKKRPRPNGRSRVQSQNGCFLPRHVISRQFSVTAGNAKKARKSSLHKAEKSEAVLHTGCLHISHAAAPFPHAVRIALKAV
ncbi:MAG: hypothetical protein IJC61_02275 [Oscillospiraceae bacterium]|nr:hypothetical protein [Oscillospiraceae bacterium]